ncbi:MAG: gamma-glutamyltransferase [Promethearchaeota archaeon]
MQFNYDNLFSFNSRRSPLYAKHGVVGASQPLAAEAGMTIMKSGGNAADAAVATAAVLNVVEPMSTGVGGDCFCLFYDSTKKKVFGLNGSGRSPKKMTLDYLHDSKIKGIKIPSSSPHAITVPGTVAGWIDTVSHFGTMDIGTILQPAIKIAEEGFPVSPLISIMWGLGRSKLKRSQYGMDLLLDKKSPKPGQIFRNLKLANVFREIAEKGISGFYQGWVADEIIDVITSAGGIMSHDDLTTHESTLVNPISTNYRGIDIYEIPPNGQGITALLALNILEGFDISSLDPNSSEYYHLMIECLRLAFADSRFFVADMDHYPVPIKKLLSKTYAKSRRGLIDEKKATVDQIHGAPQNHSDTVYLAAADSRGNACSFINSNYESFGTGIVPKNTGFVLQNRGSCFTLIEGHPNVVAPGKRPYHTIIPGMATKKGELFACFGIMGGYNQPQAHVQAISKLIDFGYNPQASLDSLRFTILGGTSSGTVAVEDGINSQAIDQLRTKGHKISIVEGIGRSVFGNGQIIMRDPENGVYIAGSDPRCDGYVIGY